MLKYTLYTGIFVVAYAIGSIPTAYLIAKWRAGVDLTTHRSRNIGAMNLTSILGWGWGVLTIILDGLKGMLPVFAGYLLNDAFGLGGMHYTGALGAVWGHNFSVYMRFKGGRGIATVGGSLLLTDPISFAIVFAVVALVRVISGYSAISNLTLAIIVAPVLWIMDGLVFGQTVMFQLLYGVGVCMAIFLSYFLNPDEPFVEVEWE